MTVVVDSNIVASLVIPTPYTPQALGLFEQWGKTQERLAAPMLFEYEIATILRRSVVLGQVEKAQIATVLTALLDYRVITIVPTITLHQEAIRMAERIGQSKAYDAHYLALAIRENATLWTADRRLANAAQQIGLTWVHWIGDWTPDQNP